MSYILDALRKVEREKNQPVTPSIKFDRPIEQPEKSRWGRYVVLALVIINLIWLGYNALAPKSTDSILSEKTTKTIDVPDALKEPPVKAIDNKKPNNTKATQTLDDYKKKPKHKQASNSPQSISELMVSVEKKELEEAAALQAKKTQVKPKPPAPLPTQVAKPATQKQVKVKPAVVQQKPVQQIAKAKTSKPTLTTQAKKANKRVIKPVAKRPATKPAVKSAVPAKQKKVVKRIPKKAISAPRQLSTAERNRKNNVPLLRQMPSNFSEQIPKLNINVYVFSEEVENAFVIINMRKFRVNDQIGEGIQLDNIGKDAITLNKNGTKFRIPRP